MRLTIEQAVRKGYKDVYFTWHGLGDNIVMFFAAETYFKTKGKKLLISTNLPDLLDNSDYCDFIDNINTSDFSERYKILQKAGITPHFLSCTRLKWLNENENVILWPDCHIAASYCSQLGISGKIDIQPRLYFSDEEKSFGRFFEKKQIAIMTDGMQNYKTYPFEKLQKIVNELKNDYNFVQIGKKSDQKLKNCLDKRGAFTIRQVAAVLHNSDCFVGGIGGLMHLAKASGCPAVITYSKGEPFYYDTYPENINVVGIIKQNEQSTATAMNGGIGYLKDLKEYVINKTNEADIVKEQKENPETNVFTGLEFPKSGEKSEFNFSNLSNEQKMAISQMSTEEIAKVMDTYTKNQNASYENNLKTLGAIDLDKPSSILIYPKTFESKELIAKAIEDYNKKQRDDGKEENTITYTDLVGAMMSSITNIIDAVSYALIAFVSISLVVSSIMIGIITYISVLERTKEIGILRAIGASKKDISRVFNAETFIIGLISGMIGVGITLLLTLPINSIIYALSGVAIHATVSVTQATILVLISLGLTILAGLIPAKMASKKDPVEALRTE